MNYQRFAKNLAFLLSIVTHYRAFSEAVLEIPVLPQEEKLYSGKELSTFESALSSLENPESSHPNEERINTQKINSGLFSKSIFDTLKQITSGEVRTYGGENGVLDIHLRGARSLSPEYFYNGFPLQYATNGASSIALMPKNSIALMEIYPDNASFWIETKGTGGTINLESCQKETCFTFQRKKQNLRATFTMGSFHYSQLSLTHGRKLSSKLTIFESVEYTTSQEDYPIFNNNYSTLTPDQGFYQNIQNNDFKRLGASLNTKFLDEKIGEVSTSLLYAHKNQGVPGVVGTISSTRNSENIFLSTVSQEKTNPENGINWHNQLGFMYSNSTLNNPLATVASQTAEWSANTQQIKSGFLWPYGDYFNSSSGFQFEIIRSQANMKYFANPAAPQNTALSKAQRIEYSPSLFQSISHEINPKWKITLAAQSMISFSDSFFSQNCLNTNFISSCQSISKNKSNLPSKNSEISLQTSIYGIIPYVRFVHNERQPFFSEEYGSPQGILPNLSLNNESSNKFENGIQFPFGDLGYFLAQDSDLILLSQVSPITSQYTNLQNSSRQGFFVSLNLEVIKHVKILGNYQYLNSTFTQSRNTFIVPRTPQNNITASIEVQHIKLYQGRNTEVLFEKSISYHYESPFFVDLSNTTKLAIPPIWDIGTKIIVQSKSHKEIISFDIYNVLNERFANISDISSGATLSINSNGLIDVPPPGRRFYVTLTGEF